MLSTLRTYLVIATFAILPLVFVPVTQDPFNSPKWMALVLATIVAFILWAIEVLASRSIHIPPRSTALLLLPLAATASLIFSSTNRWEAGLATFGPVTFICLTLLVFLSGPLEKRQHGFLFWSLCGTTVLLSLLSIYQYLEISALLLPALTFLKDPDWTPAGNPAALAGIITIVFPLLFFRFIHSMRNRHDLGLALSAAGCIILASAFVLTALRLPEYLQQSWLSYPYGWAVLLETFKNARQAIVGAGAENFLPAFTAGRPIAMNTLATFAQRFSQGSSLAFHLATTYGLGGILGILVLVKQLLPKRPLNGLSLSRTLAIGALLFAPPSLSLLTVIFAFLLATDHPHESHGRTITIPESKQWIAGVFGVIFLLLTAAAGYGALRSYWAGIMYQNALSAIEKKEGTAAYNTLIAAISTNPYSPRMHMSYAQVNLGLANVIASEIREEQMAGTATSQDKKSMYASLLSQAIREAKLSISYAPRHVTAWENLASVYQALIGATAGAEQWAVASYQQAIQLDPSNPLLRFNLGSLYATQGAYDLSQTQFQAAAGLKPDYVNAIFNLAYVFQKQNNFLRAAIALKRVLELLPPASPDREKATSEYEMVLTKLTKEERAALLGESETANEKSGLTIPPTPIPTIQPQIELPEEASPPAQPVEQQ